MISAPHSTMATAKPSDDRPQKGGWAPPPPRRGSYCCKCYKCGCYFEGAKLAHQCADCAYAPFTEGDVQAVVALLNKVLASTPVHVSSGGDIIVIWMPGADVPSYRFSPAAYHRIEPFIMGVRFAHGLHPFDNDLVEAAIELKRMAA